MADGGQPAGGAAAWVRYSEELGAEICARVAAGESLMAICRDEGMPHRTSVRDWALKEPEFGGALRAAMRQAQLALRRADLERFAKARDNRGRWSTYTPEKGEAICRRVADGETVVSIAADPEMPTAATIYYWARRIPEFGDAYAEARALAADWLADEALEVSRATTPEWVWADRLKFDVIRWLTARLAPKKYVERLVVAQVQAEAAEAARAAAPAKAATKDGDEPKRLEIVVCRFRYTEDGTCVVDPPRNSHEEAVWERVNGKPYDGPFKLTEAERAKADAEWEEDRRYRARQAAAGGD